MTLWVFPIEPLEERYSGQWLRWWQRELSRLCIDYTMILPDMPAGHDRIKRGEFLDTVGTHRWKARQLDLFLSMVDTGEVRDEDWVLLHDGWNPMLECLAYVRDTEGPEFRIAGLMHAGTWDPHDYLTDRVGAWAPVVERGWMLALDRVFVATNFHRLLLQERGVCATVTGFPFYDEETAGVAWARREQLVVFPHRLAPEKQPDLFEELRRRYHDKYGVSSTWVRTKDFCCSKQAYYEALGRARVVVSTALQETWGIAMLEGMAAGCHPVAPLRLAYPETIDAPLYRDLDHAVSLIHRGLHAQAPFACSFSRWEGAIKNIVSELGLL